MEAASANTLCTSRLWPGWRYVSRISIGCVIFLNCFIRCSVQVEVRGCCALFFDLSYKLGCEELGTISEEVNIQGAA